jgi:regulator of replication initiation timing
MIKRIQNTVLQMIYDLVNLFLVDRGLTSYINKYTLKMQAPTTQEELDRRENVAGKIQLVNDIYNMLSDVQDIPTKLGILKSLLSNVVTNNEVIKLLDKEIKRLVAEQEAQKASTTPTDSTTESENSEDAAGIDEPMPEIDTSLDGLVGGGSDTESAETSSDSGVDEVPSIDTSSDQILPTPADMGVDLT